MKKRIPTSVGMSRPHRCLVFRIATCSASFAKFSVPNACEMLFNPSPGTQFPVMDQKRMASPAINAKSPTLLVINAFIPATAFSRSVNQKPIKR